MCVVVVAATRRLLRTCCTSTTGDAGEQGTVAAVGSWLYTPSPGSVPASRWYRCVRVGAPAPRGGGGGGGAEAGGRGACSRMGAQRVCKHSSRPEGRGRERVGRALHTHSRAMSPGRPGGTGGPTALPLRPPPPPPHHRLVPLPATKHGRHRDHLIRSLPLPLPRAGGGSSPLPQPSAAHVRQAVSVRPSCRPSWAGGRGGTTTGKNCRWPPVHARGGRARREGGRKGERGGGAGGGKADGRWGGVPSGAWLDRGPRRRGAATTTACRLRPNAPAAATRGGASPPTGAPLSRG